LITRPSASCFRAAWLRARLPAGAFKVIVQFDPGAYSMKRVLLLGGSAFIGRHLARSMGPERVTATFASRPVAGFHHFDARTMRLDAVVGDSRDYSHAVIMIGQTKIDQCALHPVESREVNVTGLIRIIDELEERRITPVFLSSDAVFDGRRGGYRETDDVSPVLEYGRQKAEVEAHLRARCSRHLVVRLARTFGDTPGDGTLLTQFAEDLRAGRRIRCASDQVFSPLHVDDAVLGITRLMERAEVGTFHLAGGKAFSRAELCRMVLDGMRGIAGRESQVEICSIDDFDFPEKRPRDTSLCIAKIESAVGFKPRAVPGCIGRMLQHRFPGMLDKD
jgi:dTDP-4-dehydrorhamnose reductase